ncbi:MAG: matrixin family metalloprotease [Bacteriovorax sp.]|nr:matrixin family metalloprotease [Bacteriovorax sp.]
MDISKILLSFLIIFSTSAHAFTLNNTSTLVFGKDEVKVNVAAGNCANIGIDEHELISIISDAVNQYWNRSPTSRLKLRAGSIVSKIALYKTGPICTASTSCDPNPALAVDSDILITCNQNAVTFPSPSILAVTVPNNISGKTIIGSLIMINDRAGNQFVSSSRDEKVSIIAHELGHAFGLGHSPVKDSLMYYATVNMRKSLGADDIDGITYLYPKQQPVSCGTISDQNNPNSWLGLLIGFGLITFLRKFQFRYLKLRPRV